MRMHVHTHSANLERLRSFGNGRKGSADMARKQKDYLADLLADEDGEEAQAPSPAPAAAEVAPPKP